MNKRGVISKKGLSTIIVTLIIILISLIAIGIFWVVVQNLIKGSSENIGLQKLTLNAEIKGVNVDNSSNNVTISIKRNVGEGDLVGMKFVFYNNSNTEIISETLSLNQLEERRFVFHLSMNVSNLLAISIVPIFSSSTGEENVGNIIDSFNVRTGKRIDIPPTGNQTCTSFSGNLCAGRNCGTVQNGTCGTINCAPGCSGGQTCNSSGQCVSSACVPTTCAALGHNCGGPYNNGTCGGNLFCGIYGNGSCQSGYNCVAGTCVMQTASNYVELRNPSNNVVANFTTITACKDSASFGAGYTCLVYPGIYREEVSVYTAGTLGNPVTLKSAVPHGAILDGSEIISTPWSQCNSVSCPNNPNSNIWYTDLSSSYGISSAKDISIYQNGQMLYMSEYPNMPDQFFYDDINNYLAGVDAITTTSLTDSRLSAIGGANLVGTYVALWCNNNVVNLGLISAYNSNTITFSSACTSFYSNSQMRWAIINSPRNNIFERAGEFYYDENTRRLYVLPYSSIGTNPISIAMLDDAFNFGFMNNVVLDGFQVQSYKGIGARMLGTEGVEVKNNRFESMGSVQGGASGLIWVNNAIVKNNYLSHVIGSRGIYGEDAIVRNNTLIKISASAMLLNPVVSTLVENNTISDCYGVHSNGVAIYGESAANPGGEILFIGNIITNTVRPLTTNYLTHLVVKNNVLHGTGESSPISLWTFVTNMEVYNNVLLSTYVPPITIYSSEKASSLIIRNNIMSRPENEVNITSSNNIYTANLAGYTLKSGEFYELNLNNIFVDAANENYALRSGSVAINAGTNLAGIVNTDILGTSRPQGSAWDIGAYEYH